MQEKAPALSVKQQCAGAFLLFGIIPLLNLDARARIELPYRLVV